MCRIPDKTGWPAGAPTYFPTGENVKENVCSSLDSIFCKWAHAPPKLALASGFPPCCDRDTCFFSESQDKTHKITQRYEKTGDLQIHPQSHQPNLRLISTQTKPLFYPFHRRSSAPVKAQGKAQGRTSERQAQSFYIQLWDSCLQELSARCKTKTCSEIPRHVSSFKDSHLLQQLHDKLSTWRTNSNASMYSTTTSSTKVTIAGSTESTPAYPRGNVSE